MIDDQITQSVDHILYSEKFAEAISNAVFAISEAREELECVVRDFTTRLHDATRGRATTSFSHSIVNKIVKDRVTKFASLYSTTLREQIIKALDVELNDLVMNRLDMDFEDMALLTGMNAFKPKVRVVNRFRQNI